MGLFNDWVEGEYGWTTILVIVIFFTLITIWFYYTRDKYEPEPFSRILVAYFYGMISVIPALIISLIAVYFVSFNILLTGIIIAPVIEEFTKGYFVVHLSKHDSFDGPLDGIIYGSMVGSGFATIENLLYGFSTSTLFSINEGVELTFYRSLAQIIGHPLYTGLMGAGVGAYKVGLKNNQYNLIWQSILFHGLWNGAASSSLAITFIGGLIIVAIISIIRLRDELQNAIELDRKAFERGYYEQKQQYLEYMKNLNNRLFYRHSYPPINNIRESDQSTYSQQPNQINHKYPTKTDSVNQDDNIYGSNNNENHSSTDNSDNTVD